MTDRHYEHQYLDLLKNVWDNGLERIDRTGVGTRSLFGATMRFDLTGGAVPLLTTKKVAWKTATREMLWFLTGDSNIRELVKQGVHIWTDWPLDRYRKATGEQISRDDFEARIIADEDFAIQWGDLGPVYGVQWTKWPSFTLDEETGLYRKDQTGINQIQMLIESLSSNPASRRHLVSGWNVADLDRVVLPSCHAVYQWAVTRNNTLSCVLLQRSADSILGLPFNIFGASLLTTMIAHQVGLEPGELIWNGGDVHVYLNHEEAVREQVQRVPSGAPKLRILRKPNSIFDYRIEDFEVYDYAPQAHIAAPVAV